MPVSRPAPRIALCSSPDSCEAWSVQCLATGNPGAPAVPSSSCWRHGSSTVNCQRLVPEPCSIPRAGSWTPRPRTTAVTKCSRDPASSSEAGAATRRDPRVARSLHPLCVETRVCARRGAGRVPRRPGESVRGRVTHPRSRAGDSRRRGYRHAARAFQPRGGGAERVITSAARSRRATQRIPSSRDLGTDRSLDR